MHLLKGGRWALLGLAAVVGVALGMLDISHWLAREMTPSAARRLGSVTSYAAGLSGLLAVVAASLVELLVALGRRRGWRLAAGSGHGVRWTGWAFAIAFSTLLLAAERRFSAAVLAERRGVLVLCLTASVALTIGVAFVAARLPYHRLDALTRRAGRPRWWLAASAVALGIAVVRVTVALPAESEPPRRRAVSGSLPPNIVLVVADTLRADALGCYGSSVANTPVLDALATRGVLFERVVAPSSWTLPSVVSILSSSYPHQHGFVDFVDTLRKDVAYLPEILARHGYRTLASVGNMTMAEWRGFARGFDFYDVYGHLPESRLVASRLLSGLFLLSGLGSSAEPGRRPLLWPQMEPPFLRVRWSYYAYDRETNRPLVDRLEQGLEAPFFLYVHYLAPHEPYLSHPSPFFDSMPPLAPENLDELRARYRSEVSYLDEALGELLGALERSGHLGETVVAFTSDHGEAFLEHGRWSHGRDVYQEVVAVPLILAGPGLPQGVRHEHRVGLTDLAPTLLDLAGLEPPSTFRGQSLLPAVVAPSSLPGSRVVLAETSSRMLTPEHRFTAAFDDRWKLIRRADRNGGEVMLKLYDLESDPLERNPLPVGAGPAGLVSTLEHVAGPTLEVGEEELGEEELGSGDLEVLRALGYID